jgi:hypothetical protein
MPDRTPLARRGPERLPAEGVCTRGPGADLGNIAHQLVVGVRESLAARVQLLEDIERLPAPYTLSEGRTGVRSCVVGSTSGLCL